MCCVVSEEWCICSQQEYVDAGIWQEGEDGTDINACAKANKRPLLASADDFGRVNLYRFPSCYLKVRNIVLAYFVFL